MSYLEVHCESEYSMVERQVLNYWKGNYTQINKDMREINWDSELADKNTEDAWNTFKHTLQSSVQQNVPVKTTNKKLRKNPWITRAAKRKLQKRDKAWKKYRTIPTEVNYKEYKMLRNNANKKVKEDRANYRKRILKSFKGKPKRFYGYMQKLRTVRDKVARLTKANGKLTETDGEVAQTLADCFSNVFVHEPPLPSPLLTPTR